MSGKSESQKWEEKLAREAKFKQDSQSIAAESSRQYRAQQVPPGQKPPRTYQSYVKENWEIYRQQQPALFKPKKVLSAKQETSRDYYADRRSLKNRALRLAESIAAGKTIDVKRIDSIKAQEDELQKTYNANKEYLRPPLPVSTPKPKRAAAFPVDKPKKEKKPAKTIRLVRS